MTTSAKDTIIVSARKQNFEDVFLAEQAWYPISISDHKIGQIKYIAVYQTVPISAITHYAKVKDIEKPAGGGKCKVRFSKPVTLPCKIPLGDAPVGTIQGIRYASFEKLTNASSISELF